MCGLCGFAGLEAGRKERDIFKEHLWMMAVRGYQSTGVAGVRRSGTKNVEVTVRKETKSSANFIFAALGDKKSFIHNTDNDVLLGHCRWPTKGDVTEANAHPFEHGDLVGAHNGTIWGMAKDGKTDSEILIMRMAEIGIREALEELYTSDAYAISVYDKKRNRLYLARNKLRPLFVGIDQRDAVLHWSSDQHILRCVSERVGEKDEYWGKPCDLNILCLAPNVLYEIPIDKIEGGKEPWEQTEIKPKEWPTRSSSGSYTSYGMTGLEDGDWYPDTLDEMAANNSATVMPEAKGEKSNILLFLERKEKVDICASCGVILSDKEKKELTPFRAGGKWVYLCESCDPAPLTTLTSANLN